MIVEIRVSDYIAHRLADEGVRAAFMLSGGAMMHLIDAVGRESRIKYFCNHHEQAAAMAAEGYARQSGSIGLCYATSGPGGTNLVTGIAGSWLDSVPVFFLTGQSKVACTIQGSGIQDLRQFGTFEVDIVPIVKSITKYAVQVDDPQSIRFHLEKALYLATHGRPGPVLLDIPLDIQGAKIDPAILNGFEPEESTPATLDPALLEQIREKLQNARRPLLLAGHGINSAGAAKQFLTLLESWNVPVVTTQLGKDLLAYDSPLFVGHPGVKGDRPGNFAVQTADVILTLGCSLHEQTTGYEADGFAPDAYKIQVELDEGVTKREHVGVALKVQSSVGSFLEQAAKQVHLQPSDAHQAWRERCLAWKTTYAVSREPHVLGPGPVNFYDFAERLSLALPESATVVTDAGSAFYVMGQAFRLKQGQRYLVSGALGSMGYALPASIGVCTEDPTRTVVCVTGDGSLMLNLQELEMVRYHQFNLKMFIVINGGYASIRNTQQSFFSGHLVGSSVGSGVSIPPLDKLADAFQVPYVECADSGELQQAIDRVLAMEGPVFCGIQAQPDQKIMPSVSSKLLPNGKMKSMPLHHMFPFQSDEELASNMEHGAQ